MISDQRQVISDTFHTSLVSTASEHMSFVSYCSLIHGLKVVLSQLVIELQALSMIGTSYKKRANGAFDKTSETLPFFPIKVSCI